MITGGGSGIGRGIAEVLAAAGATVIVTGRRAAPLDETVALVRGAGGNAAAFPLDIRDSAAVDATMRAIASEFDGIDALVNNAGVGGPNACSADGEDRWDEIVRTNLDGLFFCSRAALPHIPDGGRVVNIASVLGRFGVPGYTAYCASKHGVIGFSKALALEVAARRITVNAICPGWVDTEMARVGMEGLAEATGVSFEQARDDALGVVPIQRLIEPREVGALVRYLVSADAGAMTGQAVSLCGGATMW